MTRSLPLARSSRTSGFAQIPFAASQAAQVPGGEGETFSRFQIFLRFDTQSSADFTPSRERSLARSARCCAGGDIAGAMSLPYSGFTMAMTAEVGFKYFMAAALT